MAKPKKHSEERKPDLAVPDQEALEKRVHEMLDIEEDQQNENIEADTPKSEPKKVEVQVVASAPELPSDDPETTGLEEDLPEKDDSPKDPEIETEVEEPKEKIVNLDEAPKDAAIIQESDLLNNVDEEPKVDEPVLENEHTDIPPTVADEEITKTKIDTVLEDNKTARLVDDIIAKEGDELLEIEDQKQATNPNDQKLNFRQKIGKAFRGWWNNPKARWTTIAIILALVIAVLAIPVSRYYVLNVVGVRGSASIRVVDDSTGQPLKNVEVSVAGTVGKTDTNGSATLAKVKLGSTTVIVHKRAFADSQTKTTIQLGSNSLSQVRLRPTGTQYSFMVKDFLSDKPIEKVEASYHDASAISDDQGRIKLTIDGSQDKESLQVSFNKDDYKEKKLDINTDEKSEQAVVMTYARRHMYVSKRTGKYDVYAADVDGKNEKDLLPGSGSERDDISMAIHPTASVAAVVSTRDNKKNDDGFLLSTLTIVEDQNDKVTTVSSSERIQLIDWVDDNLIYVQSAAGASAGNPKRHRLLSYNYKTNQAKELATANYFNDVIVAGGKIYYAPSSAMQAAGTAQLYRINADASAKTVILNQEVWNIFRADYDNLYLSANKSWYNVRLGEDKATSISSQPTNPKSRIYVDSKDKKSSLWVDNRDGKGVLLKYDLATRNEAELKAASGLKNPVYWLNNHSVVYRVSNEQETADYIISLDGGDPKKISDVTNTNSIAQWYYY